MPDPTKSLLDALKRASRAIPGLQEKAVQTGDFSEVDRANASVDRLNSLAEEHISRRQAPPSYMESRGVGMGPAVPDMGGGGPDEPAPPPAPPANPETDRVKLRIADLLKEAQEAEDMASGFPDPRYPKFTQPRTDAELKQSRGRPIHPVESAVESVFPQGADVEQRQFVPADDPMRIEFVRIAKARRAKAENLSKQLRDLENPPEPEVMPIEPGEEPVPVAPTSTQPGAIPEIDFGAQAKGAGEPPSKPPTAPAAGIDDAATKATPEQTKEASTIAADAKKTFGDDPLTIVKSMEKFEEGAPDWEKEFRKRVEIELGQRPERTSLERVILAILYGAASIGTRWATGNWRGQTYFPDFDAEQKTYDERKRQIGRETYSAAQAGGRQAARGSAAAQKSATSEALLDKRLASNERVAKMNDETKRAIASMQGAGAAERTDISRKNAEVLALKLQYNALADAFANGFLDKNAFEAAGNPILDQIDAIMTPQVSGGK